MSDILARIVEATVAELRSEMIDWRSLHRAARRRSVTGLKYSFRRALSAGGGIRLIAEIKAASPSAGDIAPDPDVAAIAGAYRDGGAAAISVVTEPRFFRGSREWIHRASVASGLPVVMKDFVVDPVQIYRGIAAGADAILLLTALLDQTRLREFLSIVDELGRDALVEVHDHAELERAIEAGAKIIGVNNRDLRTFEVDLGNSEKLAASMPGDVLRVAESGVHSRDDVERLEQSGFHAVLVGETLLRNDDRKAAVERLLTGKPVTG